MGARSAILMYVDAGTDIRAVLQAAPPPDREATRSLVERLYPSRRVVPIGDGDLEQNCHPPTNQVYAACLPGLSVVCTEDASLDHPSRLAEPFLAEAEGRTLYLHAQFGSVDWFGYALWEPDVTLRRSLSLWPEGAVGFWRGGGGAVLDRCAGRHTRHLSGQTWTPSHRGRPATDVRVRRPLRGCRSALPRRRFADDPQG